MYSPRGEDPAIIQSSVYLITVLGSMLVEFAPEVAESIRKKLASQYRIWQKLTGGRSTGSDKNRHSKSANRRGSKQTRKDKSRDQGSDDDDKKKDSKKRKGKTSNGKDNKKTQQSDKSKSKKDNNSTDEDDEDRKKEPHKTRKDEKPNTKEKKKAPKSDERSKDNISVASRASLGRRSSSMSNRQTNVERRPSTTSQKSRERQLEPGSTLDQVYCDTPKPLNGLWRKQRALNLIGSTEAAAILSALKQLVDNFAISFVIAILYLQLIGGIM
ncbi:hypothetical protein J6590_098500 [Homalodisca vitripennis]|nr:hypothetical protein J6590_098500 [Homalodisca vitripennis]